LFVTFVETSFFNSLAQEGDEILVIKVPFQSFGETSRFRSFD